MTVFDDTPVGERLGSERLYSDPPIGGVEKIGRAHV